MVKKIITLLIALIFASYSYCQVNNNGSRLCDNSYYRGFGYPTSFPIFDKNSPNSHWDWNKLYEFILENLIYPETAKSDKVEGQIFVEFWVDTNGYTSEHRIIQGIRQDLDDEAIRVAKLVKYNVPAIYNGKSVGLCFQFSIRFTLDDEKKPSRNTFKQSEKAKPSRNSKSKNSIDSLNEGETVDFSTFTPSW